MENTDNWNECFMPVVSSENNNESFFSKLKLVGSIELLMIYLKNEGYIVSSNDNNLSVHIGCECVNIDFKLTEFDRDDKKCYNRIVFEFKYDLNEEDKQYLIEFVPIKYNNNLSYSPKEENQFKKKGLTPLILKSFEHNHIKVKHREKELEILFFENKQELYNSINKP